MARTTVFIIPVVGMVTFLVLGCFSLSLTTIAFGLCAMMLGFYFMDTFLNGSTTASVPDLTFFFRQFLRNDFAEDSSSKNPNSTKNGLNSCKICQSPECCRLSTTTRTADDDDAARHVINWNSFYIPKVVDNALEAFLQAAFENNVHDWYDVITEDKAFLVETRIHLRHALATLIHRIECVNLHEFILKKILPPSMQMLQACLTVHDGYSSAGCLPSRAIFEQKVLDFLKPHLHYAMQNRESEMAYLRNVSDLMLKKSMDSRCQWSTSTMIFLRELLTFVVLSPVMDVVADPDIVNRVLELFFDLSPMETFDGVAESEKVVFLRNFVSAYGGGHSTDSFLQVKLSDILKNPSLLYLFMNYIKTVDGPMNWLQFLLRTQEVLEKLRTVPTSTSSAAVEETYAHVRWEVWELYRNYFHETAPDRIAEFSDSLTSEMQLAMETSDDVRFLQQTLENAYRDIYAKLQHNVVVPFCSSAEFLEFVSGEDATKSDFDDDDDDECVYVGSTADEFIAADQATFGDSAGLDEPDLSDFKRRFANVLKSTSGEEEKTSPRAVDDADLDDEAPVFITIDNNCIEADDSSELAAFVTKDLSQLKVSMPRVEPRRDPATARTMYVYVLVIERLDLTANERDRSWHIDRRYHEFYVLETKLVEFHGETILGGIPLPPKKTFNTKSRAFVECMRSIFEQFLRRLLASPHLKNSELLFAFLRSHQEFTSNFFLNPLRAVKSIPAKLALERGQNLSQFMQNLVDSVDAKKTTPSPSMTNLMSNSRSSTSLNSLMSNSTSAGAVDRKEAFRKKLEGGLFKNNYNVGSGSPPSLSHLNLYANAMATSVDCRFSSVFDVLLFLMRAVFKLPKLTFGIGTTLRGLIKESLDSYIDSYLKHKLRLVLHEQRVAQLIRILMETLFYEENAIRTEAEKSERAQRALEAANIYFDVEFGLVKKTVVGEKKFDDGVEMIFECLQMPRLNKQLSYTLMDVVLRELFPEAVNHSSATSIRST